MLLVKLSVTFRSLDHKGQRNELREEMRETIFIQLHSECSNLEDNDEVDVLSR